MKKKRHSTQIEVLVTRKINLIGDGSGENIRAEVNRTLGVWKKKHERVEIISAVPAIVVNC